MSQSGYVPNREMVERVARAMGPELLKQVVFIGGSAIGFLITDAMMLEQIRATDDVDVVVRVASRVGWHQLQRELKRLGFRESMDDDKSCSMHIQGIQVDFLPDEPDILGFATRWYPMVLETPELVELSDTVTIQVISAPLALATKLEAMRDRCVGDYLECRDLEDIINLLDGREECLNEVVCATADVREFLAEQFGALLRYPDIERVIAGNLRDREREALLFERMEALAVLRSDANKSI